MAHIDVMKLAEFFEKSSIAKLSYSVENEKIVLEKYSPAPVVQMAPAANQNVQMPSPVVSQPAQKTKEIVSENTNGNLQEVKAPLVGVFYSSKAPGEPAFVTVGDTVKKGQIICLIEAMKMMSEITAPVDGVIKSVKCKNEDVVAFDDVLFEISI